MILIREAELNDAEMIANLSSQLGYEINHEKVRVNLGRLFTTTRDKVWVAMDEDEVVGWLHAGATRWVMMSSMIEIFGLVVSSKVRKKGIGRMLINKVEEWAKENGYKEVWVRSNRKRKESHHFYLGTGYTNIKDQAVYVKQISSE